MGIIIFKKKTPAPVSTVFWPLPASLQPLSGIGVLPRLPFGLLHKTELIAGKSAHPALNIRLGFRNLQRILLDRYGACNGILHEALAVGSYYVELHPVGAAIGTKIRFILRLAICHYAHLYLQYSPGAGVSILGKAYGK
jgi:hypothetical protein